MSWYGFAFLALIANSLFYVSVKWATNLKIAREKLLFLIFFGYLLGYSALNIVVNRQSFSFILTSDRLWVWLFWGAIVAIFSLLGNFQLVKATQNAPNPGYSTGIQSTNALVTAFAAFLFFGAAISAPTWIGIAIIPFGLFFLLSAKGETKKGEWRVPSVLAALLFSGMFIVYKHMGLLGFSPLEIILSLSLFVMIGFGIMNLTKRENPWKVPLKSWLPIISATIVGLVANWMMLIAVSKINNPGLPQAILSTQAVLVLGLSKIFFPAEKGGEFNVRKWLAVMIIVIGVVIIALTS